MRSFRLAKGSYDWTADLIFLACAGISWAICVAGRSDLPAAAPRPPALLSNLLILYLSLLFAYFAPIVIHELGHAALGWFAKMQLIRFEVKPLCLYRLGSKWKVSLFSRRGVAGAVIMAPRDEDRIVPKFRMMIVGGPLFSVIYAGIVLAAARRVTWPFLVAGDDRVIAWLAVLVWPAIALSALANSVIPRVTAHGANTDMKVLMDLRVDGPAARRTGAILMIQREIFGKVPSKDLTDRWLALLEEPCDGSIKEAFGRLILQDAYWAKEQFDLYWRNDARARELIVSIPSRFAIRNMLSLNCACASAQCRQDTADAVALLSSIDQSIPGIAAPIAYLKALLAWRSEAFGEALPLCELAITGFLKAERQANVSVDRIVDELISMKHKLENREIFAIEHEWPGDRVPSVLPCSEPCS